MEQGQCEKKQENVLAKIEKFNINTKNTYWDVKIKNYGQKFTNSLYTHSRKLLITKKRANEASQYLVVLEAQGGGDTPLFEMCVLEIF